MELPGYVEGAYKAFQQSLILFLFPNVEKNFTEKRVSVRKKFPQLRFALFNKCLYNVAL